jgi:hypothetical protein
MSHFFFGFFWNVWTFMCPRIFSMPPRYKAHGALKNAKEENIFMIFFNAGIGK